jgi:hypothetical protein
MFYTTFTPAQAKDIQTRIPLGRLGRIDEIADVILFLASQKAAQINGATLAVVRFRFYDVCCCLLTVLTACWCHANFNLRSAEISCSAATMSCLINRCLLSRKALVSL